MRALSRLLQAEMAWIGFFLFVSTAWAGLLVLGATHPDGPALGALSPYFHAELWRALCAVSPAGEPWGLLVLMWGLMAAAMMAPAAVPVLAAYRRMTGGRAGAGAGFAAFVGGYMAIWLGFAAVAAGAQAGLASLALLSPHAVSVSPVLTALLLLGAGLYQFSALKDACLRKCRSPLASLMSHWRPGRSGAFRMGLRHGAVCVGCCWALMLLAFVGGAMNLVWMGGAMVLMVIEKLPDIGRVLTRPLGAALIVAGGLAAARAAGFY